MKIGFVLLLLGILAVGIHAGANGLCNFGYFVGSSGKCEACP